MATSASIVTQVTGQAWIRGADGSMTALRQGMQVPVDATVVTADGASVQLQAEGAALLTVGADREVRVSAEMLQPEVNPATEAVVPLNGEAQAVLAALAAGEDPFDVLDPTAAVLDAGSDNAGGSSFTRLVSIIETTSPLALAYPRPLVPGSEEIRLGGYAGGEAATLPPTLQLDDLNGVEGGHVSIREDAEAPVMGTFSFTSPAGLQGLVVGGVPVSPGQLAGLANNSVEIPTNFGRLVLTGYDSVTGVVNYSYYVSGPQDHSEGDDSVADQIPVIVIDNQGRTSSDVLGVQILDTEPHAEDDAVIQENENQLIEVDVFDNDDGGADGVNLENGVELVAGSLTNGGEPVTGELVYNGDGTFTYTPGKGEEGTITFDYTITDADGDSSTATVTIELQPDSKPTIVVEYDDPDEEGPVEGEDPDEGGSGDIPGTQGGSAVVWEAGLAGGSKEGNNEYNTSTGGQLAIDTGNDELERIEIQGADGVWVAVEAGGTTVDGEHGTLTVYPDGSWTYELSGRVEHDDPDAAGADDQSKDIFNVRAVDSDNDVSDPAALTIKINDDAPVALDDSVAQANENESVLVDVFDNDEAGADGVDLVDGIQLVPDSLKNGDDPAPGTLVYNKNGTFTYTPADGEEGTVTFEYTLTDSEGDSTTATVTIELQPDSKPTIVVEYDDPDEEGPVEGEDPDEGGSGDIPGTQGGSAVVWEAGLAGGSKEGNSEYNTSTGGQLAIDTGNDELDRIEIQGADGVWVAVEAGGTTVDGEHGTLTVYPDGSWTYELGGRVEHGDPDAAGADDQSKDIFNVRAVDSDNDVSDPAALTIKINDDAPVALDDSVAQANENESVLVDVFDNDEAGADGVDLVDGIQLVPDSLKNGDDPAPGTLVYNKNGTFTYTPADGEEGTVTFEYSVTDTDGDTAIAKVIITLEPDSKPTVDIEPTEPALQGAAGEVSESALPEGTGGGSTTTSGDLIIDTGADALKLIEVLGADGVWVGITADGTEVSGEYGKLFVNTDGSWSYELGGPVTHPDAAKTGADDRIQDAFQVRVTDSDDDISSEAGLVIQINDDGPVAADYAAGGLTEDGTTTVLEGNVLTDNPTVTYGADGEAASNALTWGTVTATLGTGTVDLAEYGTLDRNEVTGKWTFTLDNSQPATQALTAGQAINVSFGYTLTDSDQDGAPGTVSFTITGADDTAKVTFDAGVGDDAGRVYERGLESTTDTSETTSGSITVMATDGVASVTLGSTAYTLTALADAKVITDKGVLTVTGVTPATDGQSVVITYSYTLSEAQRHPDGDGHNSVTDTIGVGVNGAGGSSDSGTLTIEIVDDVPVAVNYAAGGLTEDGTTTVLEGNVLTDNPTVTYGADGEAASNALTWGTVTATLGTGTVDLAEYGTLDRNEVTGKWTFTLDNSQPATQALTAGQTINVSFGYTLTDSDQDSAPGTVSFTITGADDTAKVTFDAGVGDDAGRVYERGLESTTDTSETTSGSISVTATDGVASVTLGSTAYTLTALADAKVITDKGVLTVTGVTPATDGQSVVITYSYTLSAAQRHPDGDGHNSVTDTIGVGVNGAGGSSDSGTLTIEIVDDVPVAVNYAAGGLTEDGATTVLEGNVLTDNPTVTYGADGEAASNALTWGTVTATLGTGTVDLAEYGTLDRNEVTGKWTFTLDNSLPATDELNVGDVINVSFGYTLTDSDRDSAPGTVSFTINGTNDAPVIKPHDPSQPEAGAAMVLLSESGLTSGIEEGNTMHGLTAADSIEFTDVDDLASALVVDLVTPAPGMVSSNGVPVLWAKQTDDDGVVTLTGTAGSDDVLIVTINQGGNYTVELKAPLDHEGIDLQGSSDVLQFMVGVTVSDGKATTTSTIAINIEDDAPVAEGLEQSATISVSTVSVGDFAAGFVKATATSGSGSLYFYDNDDDAYDDQIKWGDKADKSGYTFVDNDDLRSSTGDLINSEFVLGTFTHNNYPVSNSYKVLDTVELEIRFTVVIDGVPTLITHTIELDHNETPNSYGDSRDDDIITISDSSLTQTFTVGDRTFELEIMGFRNPDGSLVTKVFTAENASSSFTIEAAIRSMDDLPDIHGSVADLHQFGADGPNAMAAIAWDGAEFDSVDGPYTIINDFGKFTGYADGSYKFELTREARDKFGADQTEEMTFTYVVTDADGDTATADVVITLNGEPNGLNVLHAQIIPDETSVTEGGELTYTVLLVDSDGNPVTLPEDGPGAVFALAWSGAAANDGDILNRPSSITIPGGQFSAQFTVSAVDDNAIEALEELTVEITEVTGLADTVVLVGEEGKSSVAVLDNDIALMAPEPVIENQGLNVSTWVYSSGNNLSNTQRAINSLLDSLKAGNNPANGTKGDGAGSDVLEAAIKGLQTYTPNGYVFIGNGPRLHGSRDFVGGNNNTRKTGAVLLDDVAATLYTPEQQETQHSTNKAVAEDTAVHAQGVVYLQAGETYIVKAQGDDSLRVVLGDRNLNGQEIDLRWGTHQTLTKDFEFTAIESGVYTFDMYMHNQNGAGMYDVSIVNKQSPETPLKFFPNLQAAQQAIVDSNSDDAFRLGELVGTEGHGHYKIYGYNEGPKGSEFIKLSKVLVDELPPNEEILDITISGVPDGFALEYNGSQLFAQNGEVDISAWGIDALTDLRILPPSDFTGAFNLQVSLGVKADFDGEWHTYDRTETITVRIDNVLYGTSAADELLGADGNDTLIGGGGDDILIGGAGDDIFFGGTGDDTFVWTAGDEGEEGTPAIDTVMDFGLDDSDPKGNDVLDLADLLQGEGYTSDSNGNVLSSNLDHYLHFAQDGNDTVLSISSKGDFAGGSSVLDAGKVDQVIVLKDVSLTDLSDGGVSPSQADIINNLIEQGKLNVDSGS